MLPQQIPSEDCPVCKNIAVLLQYLEIAAVYINSNRWTEPEDGALTYAEARQLSGICRSPGATVTGLAKEQHKTKSFISQNVSRLVKSGVVYKEKLKNAPRFYGIYPTEKGKRIAKNFEEKLFFEHISLLENLSPNCTEEDLASFFKVAKLHSDLLELYLSKCLETSVKRPEEQ